MGDEAAADKNSDLEPGENMMQTQQDRQERQQQQQQQTPGLMPPPVPVSSTTIAVAGCAAAIVSTTALVVVLSALRSGIAAVLLTITLSTPAVLVLLLICVWGATKYCPGLLGVVVQVLAVEVIRLSGMMADDDEEEEDESWNRMRGEDRAARLGKEWAEGRLSECRHERWRKQQQRQEEEEARRRRQGRRRRRRRRRVTVEWEDDQMYLTVHRPIASEWLIGLVNWYELLIFFQ